jgi:iron complex outermembrane recepter protein
LININHAESDSLSMHFLMFYRPRKSARNGIHPWILIWVLLFQVSVPKEAAAQASAVTESKASQLADLSLEELLNLRITSVSKKEQQVGQAPAAVYVITGEDIRRSGALTLPDALRMAPGLQVAQIGANQWAVSARGFNGRFANKLLVLMDGRSVYSPLFSGVQWDVQDTLIEDIDRIEVIRGPGASLWGANAVNGVINIITKEAKETQGALLMGGAGTEFDGFGGVRYGGKFSDKAFFRVYAKYFSHDGFVDEQGHDTPDDWHMMRGGFRVDWELDSQNDLTLQGDAYTGRATVSYPTDSFRLDRRTLQTDDLTGGNLLSRWKSKFSEASEAQLQVYYDRSERHSRAFSEMTDTINLDGQHRFLWGNRNEIVWGAGYERIADHDLHGTFAAFDPESRASDIFSAFLQDEIEVVEDRLRLTLGSKFEHNDYTGFEVQPNARLLFNPRSQHTIWASAARAVRTPARFENDVRLKLATVPGPTDIEVFGNRGIRAEELVAYELGYRVQVTERMSVDAAAFYNTYDDLQTAEAGRPFLDPLPVPHAVLPLRLDNKMNGETYGLELAASWRPTDFWKIAAGYTLFKARFDLDSSSTDLDNGDPGSSTPQQQVHVRSYLDLPHNLQFDTAFYYMDRVDERVEGYLRCDLRLGWRPRRNLELAVGVQNLFDNQHLEFPSSFRVGANEIPRSAYGKVTWQF